MARIFVFTGKGGVGKTSVAAAHARKSANEGIKTLIVSTDMAHNLSDIFEITLGKETKEVSPNLFALEIDPNHIMENEFHDMTKAFTKMLQTSKMPLDSLQKLNFFPGMDELFSLLKIMEIHESGTYERIMVDCAPTGETLSLLKFPELLSWYMEKFFPVGKVAMRVLSPISKLMFRVELPDQKAMTDIERMYLKMVQLQELLKNRDVTSIRLVSIPEKMVVDETKRNYMYMNLFDFQVDGLYINRILPKDIDNTFFNEWIHIQRKYMEELEQVFGTIPVYHIPWFDSDLNGMSGVDRITKCLQSEADLFALQPSRRGEEYEKTETGYQLKLHLPCVEKGELQLHESETDIILKIANFKRNIPRPNTLRSYEIAAANLEEETLIIDFAKK